MGKHILLIQGHPLIGMVGNMDDAASGKWLAKMEKLGENGE